MQLVPRSPAQECGVIKLNDILYRVDDRDVAGLELEEVSGSFAGVGVGVWG